MSAEYAPFAIPNAPFAIPKTQHEGREPVPKLAVSSNAPGLCSAHGSLQPGWNPSTESSQVLGVDAEPLAER